MFSFFTSALRSSSEKGRQMSASAPLLTPSKWSRKSLLLASSTLTILIFSLDSCWQDHKIGLSQELVFYVLGIGAALFYMKFVKALPARLPSGKGSKKQYIVTQKGSCSPKSQPVSDDRNGASKVCRSVNEPQQRKLGSSFPQGAEGDDGSNKAVTAQAAIHMASSKHGALEAGVALERLQRAGSEIDTTCYNIVIQAYAKEGRMAKAEEWLDRLIASGHTPTEYSFAALLSASAKATDSRAVEAWLQKMSDHGVAVSSTTFSALIHTHARNGQVDDARLCLQHMEKLGVRPDAAIYNSMIHACSAQSDAAGAKWWFERMTQLGLTPSVTTFTQLIDVCSKTLDLDGAEYWMNIMKERSIEPNVVSYSTMINVCAKVKDLDRAEYWYNAMQEHGVQPNEFSYSALINACARVGDVSAACSWLERAEQGGANLDGVVYSCVINACAKIGDSAQAMSIFEKMRALGIKSHIVTYAALARPFAYSGDWPEVERIADMLKVDGIPMNDYFLYTLLLAYSRAKPRESTRAESAFRAAVEDGMVINDRLEKALASAVGKGRCAYLIRKLCNGEVSSTTPTNARDAGAPARSKPFGNLLSARS